MLKLFSRKSSDPHEGLRAALGEQSLPVFPAVVLKALEQIRDVDGDLAPVADTVSSDPGLSVKLIKIVNSASFALRHRVRSVHHAVSLLGRTELESILISSAVREALPRASAPGFDPRQFWLASARRATTARAIATRIDPSHASESFTAALLQDMALPLLAHKHSDSYGSLVEAWNSGDADLVVMERERYGWDHTMIGSWMSTDWQFPERLTEAIAVHHGSEEDEGPGLAAVNLVAQIRENDDPEMLDPMIQRARDEFALAEDETRALIEAGRESAEEIAALFT